MVPTQGILSFKAACKLDVPTNPPKNENSVAVFAPSGPWALLIPNSIQFLGSTALHIRLAFVATSEEKPNKFKMGVSKSCTRAKGPVYVIRGSLANTSSPSFMAMINLWFTFNVDFGFGNAFSEPGKV